MKIDDTLNIGTKFIITYRPFTHNGEERKKLKDNNMAPQCTEPSSGTIFHSTEFSAGKPFFTMVLRVDL